jgi:hypothetical protein
VIFTIILGNLYYEYLENKYYTEGNDGSPLITIVADLPNEVITEIDQTKDKGMFVWLQTNNSTGDMRLNKSVLTNVDEWIDKSSYGSNLTPSARNDKKIIYNTNYVLFGGKNVKGIFIDKNKAISIENKKTAIDTKDNNITKDTRTTTIDNKRNMKEYLFFVFATGGDDQGKTKKMLYLLGPSANNSNNRQIYINNDKIYYGFNTTWIHVNIPHGLLTREIYVLECCLTIDKHVTIILNKDVLFNDSQESEQILNYNDDAPISDYICIGTGADKAPDQKSDMDMLVIELLIYNKNVTDIKNDMFINFVRKRHIYATYLELQGFQNMIESFGVKESLRDKWSFNNELVNVTPFKNEFLKKSVTGYKFDHASKNISFTINDTNEDSMYLNGNYKIIYNSLKYNGDENNSPLNAFSEKLPNAAYPPLWSIKLPPRSSDTSIILQLPYYFVLNSYTLTYATDAQIGTLKYQLWKNTDPIDDPWNTNLSDRWYTWEDVKHVNSKNNSPIINKDTYLFNYPFKPANTTVRVSYGHGIGMLFENTSSVEVSLEFNLSMNGYYIYDLETDEEIQCYIEVSPEKRREFGDKNLIAFHRQWRALGHNDNRNPHSCPKSNTS